MAVLDMQDTVSNAIDTKEYAIGIFLDLEKAFDMVDHAILLGKRENYGVHFIVTLTRCSSRLCAMGINLNSNSLIMESPKAPILVLYSSCSM